VSFGTGWTIRDHSDDLLLQMREYASGFLECSHSARNTTMLRERGTRRVKETLDFIEGILVGGYEIKRCRGGGHA